MLLNNKWVNNEIKEEIERYLVTNGNEQYPDSITTVKAKKDIHSNASLPQETE